MIRVTQKRPKMVEWVSFNCFNKSLAIAAKLRVSEELRYQTITLS